MVHIFILFLKTASDVSPLRGFRIKSQIFRANEERVLLPVHTVLSFFSAIYLYFLNYKVS